MYIGGVVCSSSCKVRIPITNIFLLNVFTDVKWLPCRLKNSSGKASCTSIFYFINALLVAIGVNSHTEEEIQEANQRNRAVSSSAIQRAMTDANSGMYYYHSNICYYIISSFINVIHIYSLACTHVALSNNS